jgi:hypothetical protein
MDEGKTRRSRQERARVRKLLPTLDSLLRYHADRILVELDKQIGDTCKFRYILR